MKLLILVPLIALAAATDPPPLTTVDRAPRIELGYKERAIRTIRCSFRQTRVSGEDHPAGRGAPSRGREGIRGALPFGEEPLGYSPRHIASDHESIFA
jgi:hypothetical protein